MRFLPRSMRSFYSLPGARERWYQRGASDGRSRCARRAAFWAPLHMESLTAFLVALALVFQFLDWPRAAGTCFAVSLVGVVTLLRFHATSSLNLSF
jgi:hypothetical protein